MRHLTVVELFTAQGCETCLPAEETLAALNTRDDVLALSMHIDYWDYMGWEDPFAAKVNTQRQRAYQRRLGGRFLYTPQIVIDGQAEVLASDRETVLAAVESRMDRKKVVQPEMVMNMDGTAKLVVPEVADFDGEATIWIALFDYNRETLVKAGENEGRTLQSINVVRDLVEAGQWTGERIEIPLDVEAAIQKGREGCAILVQMNGHGPIIGAAAQPLRTS